LASIADVWISVLPDTSKIAPKIKEALRTTERELKAINVDVEADTAAAKTEIARLDGQTVKVKVDVDRSALDRAFSGFSGGGSSGGGAFKLNAGLVGVGLLPAAATAVTNLAGALQQLAGAGAVVPGVFAGIASSVGVAKLSVQGMSDAYDAVTKAADGTQASVDAANKALADLSPNAADAVKTVVGLKGTFTDLRNIGSQNMFAGVSQGLMGLVGNLLPAVTRGVDGISRSLNQNLMQAMTSLGSGSSQGFLDRIFGNTADAQGRLSAAIDPIINAFGTLAAAGSDSLPRLADAVGRVAERFNAFITSADGDGRLQKWISDGLDGFSNLGNIVLNLGKSFTAITEAAGGGAGLLFTLESATQKMAAFLNSAQGQERLQNFFQQGRDMLGQLRDVAVQAGPILSGLFQAGTNAANLWLPVIRQVLQTINSIPGGAATVVQAFVAWKTISGVASLASSLTGIVNLLSTGLPNAAVSGVGKMSGALDGLIGKFGIVAAAATAAYTVGQANPLMNPSQPLPNGTPQIDISKMKPGDHFGVDANGNMTVVPGSGPGIPSTYQPPTNLQLPGIGIQGGGGAGAQADRRGVPRSPFANRPPTPTSGWNATPAPAISTYMPPVVTEAPSGSASTPFAYSSGAAPGYISDQALLANVPAGSYTNGPGDLTKGLADCSSAVEDLVNLMDGKSTAGRSLATGNAASLLPQMGFVRGMGGPGDFRVGYNSEHMQATLPGGTPFNWGSDAAAARGGVGGTGADDKAFTDHWYRPVSGSAAASMYPGMDGGATGLTSQDLTLRNANQRVADSQARIDSAQGRLNELDAKGDKVTPRQRAEAERALAVAKREHADAIDALSVAQNKYNSAAAKDKDGNGDMSSLGGDLFGGVLEAIGLDGSLFKNPFQSGMWKGVTGVANFAGALGQGQAGQTGSMIPGGSGGGLGGLLGLASSFMPGMPGGNSLNIADAAQFKPPGGANSPGPGNAPAGGPTINLQGASFGDSHGELQQQITNISSSMPRWPALAQNLPQ